VPHDDGIITVGGGVSVDDDGDRPVSICEALDRVLHKGVVLRGEITITVADIDLVYLGLHLLVASADTARRYVLREVSPDLTETRGDDAKEAA
jgi:gas vesicle structural protein